MKLGTIILHSRVDDVVPFADSLEVISNSGLPSESLIAVGTEHRLADEESLAKMLEAVEEASPLEPELKMMLETTARLSPLRPPAIAHQFGVPRRFGIRTLFLITAMYAILFGVLRAFEATPLIFAFIALFFTVVALGQMLLFKGKRPRRASVIVGACFLSCWALVSLLVDSDPAPPIALGSKLVLFLLFVSLLGALLGCISGSLISGVFLVLDKLGHLRDKPKTRDEMAGARLIPALP